MRDAGFLATVSPNQIFHRQVVLAFMEDKANSEFNDGYDAKNIDNVVNDMYLVNGTNKLIIEGEGYFNKEASYPIGVKNKGVKHDIPQIPTFFHNFTANLVRRENSFAGVFLYFCIKLRTLVPITKTLITVSIIPKMVQTAVSHHVNSNNSPAIGPLKNLIAVATITVKYFPMAIAK